MKKYIGWIFALVTCLTAASIYADEADNNDLEDETVIVDDNEEQVAIVDDEDLEE